MRLVHARWPGGTRGSDRGRSAARRRGAAGEPIAVDDEDAGLARDRVGHGLTDGVAAEEGDDARRAEEGVDVAAAEKRVLEIFAVDLHSEHAVRRGAMTEQQRQIARKI